MVGNEKRVRCKHWDAHSLIPQNIKNIRHFAKTYCFLFRFDVYLLCKFNELTKYLFSLEGYVRQKSHSSANQAA